MKPEHEIQEFLKDFDKAKNRCIILFLIIFVVAIVIYEVL